MPVAFDWKTLAETAFEPLRPGVLISRLYEDATSGASAAVLRYAPGGRVPRHRHDGYERFCLDYVEFKTRRFVVDASSNVDPDYYGGFNCSNLAPPHNGSSAGVGEALAAAIEIKRARGEDSEVLVERLRSVLGFLLQRQMLEDNCFACEAPRLALGGFTGESVGSDGRIDHVQHALSALSDGARQLALN